ncbi:nucleobase:cation symporter-2 family protein [Beijerinckia sp. L45]|uniref:nucleobase:cation symporter-2 family protein n=1 Tax=Beijerinckia sp. L45 TaxID=1641855 RepID=UPI00131C7932|nr:nucleobase:cation symporter-2 family protein [Beijerinckia sp. L45]
MSREPLIHDGISDASHDVQTLANRVTHEIDSVPPAARLAALGLQHVLVMYANAVAVPLIIGAALKLPKDQLSLLISADLFACGIATLIQVIGIGSVGIRLPIVMGVTAVAIQPMLAIAAMPDIGLLGIYGAVIAGGLFGLLIIPFVGRMLPYFPPVVTGSILTMIGIALIRVAAAWTGGGTGASDFGSMRSLAIAALVLGTTLATIRFGRGFLANVAVLVGIVVGYIVTSALGLIDFDGLASEPWFRVVRPLQFGLPTFHLVPCLIMCFVMVIVFIEATGIFLALGSVLGRPISTDDLKRGLRADAIGTLIGGAFNTFPYLSYSQNVGLVSLTGVRSRWVCAAAGVIMLAMGLVPKLAFLAASVPPSVLGGAGIVMFGMVASTGIKILAGVDYNARRNDALIIAVSLGLGLIPIVQPQLLKSLPAALQPVVNDPILLTAVVALLLNAAFNHPWLAASANGRVMRDRDG